MAELVLASQLLVPAGPFITAAVWIVIIAAVIARPKRPARREAGHVGWIELVPLVVAVIMIQLLLDLRTPGLGDAVAAGVHAVALAIVWLRR